MKTVQNQGVQVWDIVVLFPLLSVVIVLFVMTLVGFQLGQGNEMTPFFLSVISVGGFVAYVGSIASMLAGYIYGIHRLYTRTKLDEKSKLFWLWMVLLFSPISVPILHFKHLRATA